MWIHAWGLIHSIFVTVPFRITCFLASYSAANAWCADAGTIMPIQGSISAAAMTAPTLDFLPTGAGSPPAGRAGTWSPLEISFIPVLLCQGIWLVRLVFATGLTAAVELAEPPRPAFRARGRRPGNGSRRNCLRNKHTHTSARRDQCGS